jgi:hypothetical protein
VLLIENEPNLNFRKRWKSQNTAPLISNFTVKVVESIFESNNLWARLFKKQNRFIGFDGRNVSDGVNKLARRVRIYTPKRPIGAGDARTSQWATDISVAQDSIN